jgi:hypothetical protein
VEGSLGTSLSAELALLPFGPLENQPLEHLQAIANATAVSAYSALFSAHRALREYKSLVEDREQVLAAIRQLKGKDKEVEASAEAVESISLNSLPSDRARPPASA